MQYQAFQLASALSPKEWKRFLKQALLTAESIAPDLRPFLQSLAHYHPAFTVEDEALHKVAFPGKPYDNARLRVLRTYLKDLVEDFIVHTELEHKKTLRELVLVQGLLRRNCLEAASRQLPRIQDQLPDPNLQLLEMEYGLRLEEMRLDLAVRKQQVSTDYPWDSLLRQVDDLAMAKRLRLLVAIMGSQGFLARTSNWFEEMLQGAVQSAHSKVTDRQPLIAIYRHLLCLLQGREGENHLHSLRQLLVTHGPAMDPPERINVYRALINHLFQQDRKRVPGSLEQIFDTYQEMHRQNLIFGAGAYSESTVRNIVSCGVRLGQLEWTRAFIEEARTALPEPERENIFHHGLASLYFAEGRYSEAKRHLTQLNFVNPFYRLSHDSLLMRICYETNDADTFHAILAAVSRHLYRTEQIAPSYRKGMLNQAKAIAPMFDLRWNPNPKMSLPALKQYIEGLNPISHLEWIQAKLQELEASSQL
jgi:hypothetical protein